MYLKLFILSTHIREFALIQTQLHTDLNMLRDRELVEELHHAVTVFTREFSAVPGYSTL